MPRTKRTLAISRGGRTISRSKVIVLWIPILVVSACASEPTYENRENFISHTGVIEKKRIVTNPAKEAEFARAEEDQIRGKIVFGVAVILGGAIGGALAGASGLDIAGNPSIPGEPVRYSVLLNDGRQAVAYSRHSGFEVGDCVTFLVGEETGDTRIAYGGGCDAVAAHRSDGNERDSGPTARAVPTSSQQNSNIGIEDTGAE